MAIEKHHICIYCKKLKLPNEFNREHVLHDAYGKYEPRSFVLKNKVCEKCNNQFGRTIDQELCSATYEGFQRFQHHIKDHKDFRPHQHSRNLKHIVREGPFQGLELIPAFCPKGNKVGVPTKDIGLKKADGSYDFFSINHIPPKETAEKKYPNQHERILILLPEKAGQIITALQDEWQQRPLLNYTVLPFDNFDVSVNIDVTYTKSVFRAIAKIAFNYLAFHNESQVVLQDCFNPIRSFISDGVGEWTDYVQIDRQPILEEENNQALDGHIIILRPYSRNGPIVLSVSLLNYIRYNICLTPKYAGIALKSGFGHFFDPHGGRIEPIHKSSLISSRQIQTLQIVKSPPIWIPKLL